MNKSQYFKILKNRLYLYFIDEMLKDVNNYIIFYKLENRDAIIHDVLNTAKEVEETQYKPSIDDEAYYYMLLTEQYESVLSKAKNSVLQNLKAQQIEAQKKLEQSPEYKKQQLQKELDATLIELKKELGKSAKRGAKKIAFGGAFLGACGAGLLAGLTDNRSKRKKFLK